MKKRAKQDAESFEQALTELKTLRKDIDDIYYCPHIGNWNVKYGDGSSEEFMTIIEIVHFCIILPNEPFSKIETLVL